MSKTIRLEETTYRKLEAMLRLRETFNEAVVRLLRVYDTLFSVSETLGPSHYLKERPFDDAKVSQRNDR